MLITKEYLEQQQLLHAAGNYGTEKTGVAEFVLELAKQLGTEDILDYGCGQGWLAKQLPFPIKEYDPCIPGKDAPAEPAQFVVCLDVLEHIEPECLEAVLDDLERCVLRAGYLAIHTGPAVKVLADGRNAHLIQEGPGFWLTHLAQRFLIHDARQDKYGLIIGVLARPQTS